MPGKMVRYRLEDLPPISDEELERLKALAARPDSEIDTSDIPELTAEQWKGAVRGRLYRPVKEELTAKVDVDVLGWLKSQGDDYESRLNAILRREMLASAAAETNK